MNILITNDDGWGTQGILTLVRAMLPLGHVIVIAPDGPRSGAGVGITVNKPMLLKKIPNIRKSMMPNWKNGLQTYLKNSDRISFIFSERNMHIPLPP